MDNGWTEWGRFGRYCKSDWRMRNRGKSSGVLLLKIRLWNWLFREIWTRQRSVYAVVLAVLGLNHKTVSVDIREKFSISEESAREGLLHLSEQTGIKEAVVLSTCNRTEIYAVLKDEEDKEELYRFFLTLSGNSKAEKEYFFFYTGTECIRHLFRVVSGLDSMVLGESQILNQIKTAYTGALAVHATRTI